MTPLEQQIKSAKIHISILQKYTDELKDFGLPIQRFDIIPSLLNRMLEVCSSILLLAENHRFKTMEILGRAVFESYTQLVALIQHPEACDHYALFELIKEKKTAERFMAYHARNIASGMGSQIDHDFHLINQDLVRGWNYQIDSIQGKGIELRTYSSKGKEKNYSNWYGNYFQPNREMNFRQLCIMLDLLDSYEVCYVEWSKSTHTASVSMGSASQDPQGITRYKFKPESELSALSQSIVDFVGSHSTQIGIAAHRKFNTVAADSILQEIRAELAKQFTQGPYTD